jgi:hypothetical protein
MYIFNKFNIFHSIPDDMALPAGARVATAKEVAEWTANDLIEKAAIKAKKDAARAERAQLVVISAPAVEEVTEPAKGKDGKDGKPAA